MIGRVAFDAQATAAEAHGLLCDYFRTDEEGRRRLAEVARAEAERSREEARLLPDNVYPFPTP